jgi:hypothetical protein
MGMVPGKNNDERVLRTKTGAEQLRVGGEFASFVMDGNVVALFRRFGIMTKSRDGVYISEVYQLRMDPF